MTVPSNLRYTSDHEWVREEGGVAVIGITHHAQEQLGDVVYVELPALGAQVIRGTTFGTVESVKAVSDLFAPLTGEVTETNQALQDTPDAVNSDPYGAAWMVKIRIADAAELSELLAPADYEKSLAT